MTSNWQHYNKAIFGALIAFLSSLVTGLEDNALVLVEGITALIAGLSAYAVVWAVPNRPKIVRHDTDLT